MNSECKKCSNKNLKCLWLIIAIVVLIISDGFHCLHDIFHPKPENVHWVSNVPVLSGESGMEEPTNPPNEGYVVPIDFQEYMNRTISYYENFINFQIFIITLIMGFMFGYFWFTSKKQVENEVNDYFRGDSFIKTLEESSQEPLRKVLQEIQDNGDWGTVMLDDDEEFQTLKATVKDLQLKIKDQDKKHTEDYNRISMQLESLNLKGE